jgi:hypothetical protein
MPAVRRPPKRDAELSGRPQVTKQLLDIFADVQEGFVDQRERSDAILDNWDLYNCKLSDKQFYSGQSQIFLPYVRDAVNARKTRFCNQIFPQSGRYVDVITGEGEQPAATMALLETYVRRTKLQTEILPALSKNGDVEGQYTLYVGYKTETRRVTRRERVADQPDLPELGEHNEFTEDDQTVGRPTVEVIHDTDLLVLPVTADSIEDAIAADGSVSLLRRWTKGRIRRAIRDTEIEQDAGEMLLKEMQRVAKNPERDAAKKLTDAAGIKDNGQVALVYETWTNLKVDGQWVLCVAFYGGSDNILGCKRCPYWCDLPPLLSVPVEKQAGVFKGKPPVDYVADLQIFANDTINEAADTAHFSAMPIVMTDPEKNPKTATMVLGLGAVWDTSPTDTQIVEFPALWENGAQRAQEIQAQIFQTLGVNPAMVPQSTGGAAKRNQAEVANEQQVDILTTADAVGVLEEGILTPLIQRFAEYDHQFREDAITVKVYGEMGLRATMEDVEPIQLNKKFEFVWLGVEQARNAAQLQQQIAGMNVLKGIPPEQYAGYELHLVPLIEAMVINLFGPRLGPQTFRKVENVTVDPAIENDMLEHGFVLDVYPGDDDQMHMMDHMAALQQAGGVDAHGTFKDHIAKHQAQMQMKAQAQMGAQGPQPGAPGSPGGMGQPGSAGTPPGAQVGMPRVKGPPGMIHQDNMPAAGAVDMPRAM